jgi:hypothetical protein
MVGMFFSRARSAACDACPRDSTRIAAALGEGDHVRRQDAPGDDDRTFGQPRQLVRVVAFQMAKHPPAEIRNVVGALLERGIAERLELLRPCSEDTPHRA